MKKSFKSHFRFNNKIKHPAYVYSEFKNEYKYIGLTHSPITTKIGNIKLFKNPNPADTRDSYIRPFSTHDKKINFNSNLKKGYKLNKKDLEKIKSVKKKYIK
ncbi:MAG: hypothetical protein LBV51_04155 [Acholeplasmatales bacterium]|jgi:hypothetical protein|nr:hypothetical protein [Acholeplasmatales bacterium]